MNSLGLVFYCMLTHWLSLPKRNQHISEIFVTRTENRASNLISEKTFALQALKIAIVLLKQPALLKLKAVV